MGWFPPEYAHEFFVAKGIIALTATCLLLSHMTTAWSQTFSPGQRLRYLALLACAVSLTGASVEQVQQDAVVNFRNVGALVAAVAILVAMVVSIRESRRS